MLSGWQVMMALAKIVEALSIPFILLGQNLILWYERINQKSLISYKRKWYLNGTMILTKFNIPSNNFVFILIDYFNWLYLILIIKFI